MATAPVPIALVYGAASSTSTSPTSSGSALLVLQALEARLSSTNPASSTNRLRCAAVAKDHTLPTKKSPDKTRYETYTPLRILQRGWTLKHQKVVPGACVVVADIRVLNPQTCEEACARFERVRSDVAFSGRAGLPVALVVVCSKEEPDDPLTWSERSKGFAVMIKKRFQLQAAGTGPEAAPPGALAVLHAHADLATGDPASSLRLQSFRVSLYDAVCEWYRAEAKRVLGIRRGDPRRPGAIALRARHEYKAAQLYEMRGLPEKALQHYQDSYQALATLGARWEDSKTTGVISAYSAAEIRAAGEMIHARTVALRVEAGELRTALNQLALHLGTMTPLKDFGADNQPSEADVQSLLAAAAAGASSFSSSALAHPSSQTEYWEWCARQRVMFADLLLLSGPSRASLVAGLDAAERELCDPCYHLTRAAAASAEGRVPGPQALALYERLLELMAQRTPRRLRAEAGIRLKLAAEKRRSGNDAGHREDAARSGRVFREAGWDVLLGRVVCELGGAVAENQTSNKPWPAEWRWLAKPSVFAGPETTSLLERLQSPALPTGLLPADLLRWRVFPASGGLRLALASRVAFKAKHVRVYTDDSSVSFRVTAVDSKALLETPAPRSEWLVGGRDELQEWPLALEGAPEEERTAHPAKLELELADETRVFAAASLSSEQILVGRRGRVLGLTHGKRTPAIAVSTATTSGGGSPRSKPKHGRQAPTSRASLRAAPELPVLDEGRSCLAVSETFEFRLADASETVLQVSSSDPSSLSARAVGPREIRLQGLRAQEEPPVSLVVRTQGGRDAPAVARERVVLVLPPFRVGAVQAAPSGGGSADVLVEVEATCGLHVWKITSDASVTKLNARLLEGEWRAGERRAARLPRAATYAELAWARVPPSALADESGGFTYTMEIPRPAPASAPAASSDKLQDVDVTFECDPCPWVKVGHFVTLKATVAARGAQSTRVRLLLQAGKDFLVSGPESLSSVELHEAAPRVLVWKLVPVRLGPLKLPALLLEEEIPAQHGAAQPQAPFSHATKAPSRRTFLPLEACCGVES